MNIGNVSASEVGQCDSWLFSLSTKRVPSWTDRILYATYSDSPDTPDKTNIINLLYTSIPSYTTSDHVCYQVNTTLFIIIDIWYFQKPIVCLLLLPPTQIAPTLPMISLPSSYKPRPDPHAVIKRYTGRVLDRVIGVAWWLLTLLCASSVVGLFNLLVGLGAWIGWKRKLYITEKGRRAH